jgi:hypothetical protein
VADFFVFSGFFGPKALKQSGTSDYSFETAEFLAVKGNANFSLGLFYTWSSKASSRDTVPLNDKTHLFGKTTEKQSIKESSW